MKRRAEPRRPQAWRKGDGQVPLRGFSAHIHLTPGSEVLGVSTFPLPFYYTFSLQIHSQRNFSRHFLTNFHFCFLPFLNWKLMVRCFQKFASQNNHNNGSKPQHQRCLYISPNKTKNKQMKIAAITAIGWTRVNSDVTIIFQKGKKTQEYSFQFTVSVK